MSDTIDIILSALALSGSGKVQGLRVLLAGAQKCELETFFSAGGALITRFAFDAGEYRIEGLEDTVRGYDLVVLSDYPSPGNVPPVLIRRLAFLSDRLVILGELADEPRVERILRQQEFSLQRTPSHTKGHALIALYSPGCGTPRDSRPLLVHVHIPKCAGMSFTRLLKANYGNRHLDIYSPDPDYVFSADQLSRIVRANPGIVSMSSHSIRVYPPLINGRPALYVCFLREPQEQFLSYVTYIKKHFKALSGPHRAVVPDGCDQRSIREIAEWLVSADIRVPFHDNYTSRFLTDSVPMQNLGPPLEGALNDRTVAYRDGARLEMTVHILENFLFVGITEQIADCLRILQKKLALFGLDLHDLSIRSDNVSRELRGDLTWLSSDDSVAQRLKRSLEVDAQVYGLFKSRFEVERAAFGKVTEIMSAGVN